MNAFESGRYFLSLIVSLTLLSPVTARAEHWTRKEVEEFHRKFQLPSEGPFSSKSTVSSSLMLPTSPGYDQGGTGLCWMFAALNSLETNYLVNHRTSQIAMSRAVMQYVTMADRYIRKIRGEQDYIVDSGTVVDAIDLLRTPGAFGLKDYNEILMNVPKFAISGNDLASQISNLYASLDAYYGALPTFVHSIDKSGPLLTPQALGAELTGSDHWVAYGSMENNKVSKEGWAKHWDPDARPNTQAYFVPTSKFSHIVTEALSAGHAVGVSWCGHAEEIFGADFDPSGNPLRYHVKGSYSGEYDRIYEASILDRACGLSTIQSSGL